MRNSPLQLVTASIRPAMAVNVTEDSDANGDARDEPGASNRLVGTGDGDVGGGGVEGVVCCAAAAIGHGGGGGWEARGKMRPFFAKMSPLGTQPPFSAQC